MSNNAVCKVLIIEDERADREIYKRYLRISAPSFETEFDFAEADCAADGIRIARQWAPDCILLDFHLPDMDGLGVLPLLREGDGRLPCAVVMLTAFGGEGLAVAAMKSGAMDYLPKGQVSSGNFSQTVTGAVERFRMQRCIEEQRSALENSARQYQILLEAIPQMVWMANADGRAEYANSKWFEYTGLSHHQLGELGWDLLLHPEDLERTWAAWDHARQTGAVFEIEHRLKRESDGSYRWHLVRAVPFRGASGEVAKWFGTCTDIENQKVAETAHLQKEKLASIGQLAAGIAHDFNNLLVAIMGGASYALESLPPGHDAHDMLHCVLRAGERAAELTSKMLAYAGEGNLFLEATDLNQLIQEVCDSLRQSIPYRIQLNILAGPDLPPVTTDFRQMRQVVVDLVRNAVEAIHEGQIGTVTVTTASIDVDQDSMGPLSAGRYVELRVWDTGCGMDEETQKKIFDPFFSTKFAGRGLGLAALLGFVRSNGGAVEVDSAPGKGSRFRILLPAATQEAELRRAVS